MTCTVVRADNKRLPRLNLIKDMLTRLEYADKDHSLTRPNPDVAFTYADEYIDNGMIAA